MVWAFPLSLADFWDKIGVRTVTWTRQTNDQLSGLGSGQVLQASMAPGLRVADVTLKQWDANVASEIETMIDLLIEQKGTFYAYDPRKCVPRSDPYGRKLAGNTVLIKSLPNANEMSLKGLPEDYSLSIGDAISFDFGAPARRAYHRIAYPVVADENGETGDFQVTPPIMPGAVIDTPVSLIKPAFKAFIRPGSVDVNNNQQSSRSNITFSIIQKI